jgi:hypothetical protein
MTPWQVSQITQRPKPIGAVESFEAFDSGGNCAAAAYYDKGENDHGQRIFELYLHDCNDSIPRIVKGSLGEVKAAYSAFFYRKQKEGFDTVQGDLEGKIV